MINMYDKSKFEKFRFRFNLAESHEKEFSKPSEKRLGRPAKRRAFYRRRD